MISENNFYDHYKDSFEQQKNYLAKRDHYTIALLVMVVVLCLQTSDANLVKSSINRIIQKEINEDISIDFKYICVSLSYIYLWLVIQYCQICLTIENTYSYIHGIEDSLSKQGDFVVKREGSNYLKSYPWLKSLTHRIYVFFFPVLFITIAMTNAYNEFMYLYHHNISFLTILSLIANILCAVVSILYISNRWFHEEAFSKQMFPNLKLLSRIKLYFGYKK